MNNKGFTLIELVVVIAISMVLVGVMSLSFSSVANMRVNEAAEQYQAGLSNAQAVVMSKNGGHILLTDDGTNINMKIYDAVGNLRTDKQIGDSNHIETKYYTKGASGAETEMVLRDAPLDITYDAVSGAFKFSGSDAVSRVVFSNGRKSKTITLYSNTGKSVLE